MESGDESVRLHLKTDPDIVAKQALWAGLLPGMRVADIGCGAGITTSVLKKIVGNEGSVTGIDFARSRYEYAVKNFSGDGISFLCQDVREQLPNLEGFDFVFVRFVLEYYLSESFDIVRNITKILKPGGILCLIDLDYNCLNHYGIPKRLEETIHEIMNQLQIKGNFDPYVGRKLYSYLYDLGFSNIEVDVSSHHNIYGPLKDSDGFNWFKKVEIAPLKIKYDFKGYDGGHAEFVKEFQEAFSNPRRFTYTPIIVCRGVKTLD